MLQSDDTLLPQICRCRLFISMLDNTDARVQRLSDYVIDPMRRSIRLKLSNVGVASLRALDTTD